MLIMAMLYHNSSSRGEPHHVCRDSKRSVCAAKLRQAFGGDSPRLGCGRGEADAEGDADRGGEDIRDGVGKATETTDLSLTRAVVYESKAGGTFFKVGRK